MFTILLAGNSQPPLNHEHVHASAATQQAMMHPYQLLSNKSHAHQFRLAMAILVTNYSGLQPEQQ